MAAQAPPQNKCVQAPLEPGVGVTLLANTKHFMMKEVAPSEDSPHAKITIVGCGQVGMASAFAVMIKGLVSEIALIDTEEKKLRGEMMDLQHGQAFTRRVAIKAGKDYKITANSKICVITAGARQNPGESRLSLVQRNVNILKKIVPNIVKHSPNCILVIVSNPVDVLTYMTMKISGFPANRVIGSGTMLDSSRFRFLLSQKLGVSPQNCHGYIIGEHGDSSVAVWSGVSVGGIKLKDVCPYAGEKGDPEGWASLHQDVISSAGEVINRKGYTSWGIGATISELVHCLLHDTKNIHPLSTIVTGMHGIEQDVCLSLPCVLGESGISHVFKLQLNEDEESKLQKSAEMMTEVIQSVQM